MILDHEAQARLITGQAQQARRIIDEARVMQYTQPPGGEILKRTGRCVHLPGAPLVNPNRNRVDSKVTPQQIFGERGRLDHRQPAWVGIALPARTGNVDARILQRDTGRPKAVVRDCLAAQRAQQRLDLPLDKDVELARVLDPQQVADRAANEMNALVCGREQSLAPGLLAGLIKQRAPQCQPPPGAPWPARSCTARSGKSRRTALRRRPRAAPARGGRAHQRLRRRSRAR